MPFPLVERVSYRNKPLDTVICQVRFPSILRIDTEIPSIFQDKVIKKYINFIERQEISFDIQQVNKTGIPSEDIKQPEPSIIKNYEFATEDKQWKINLTRNFLTLSCGNYTRWEKFRGEFAAVLDAFVEVYKPVNFTRVGLRYKDVIVKSRLNLGDVDWKELIKPPFLGILTSNELKDNVKDFQSTFVIGMRDDPGEARVFTGTVRSATSGEICFMIDSDFYELKKRKLDELLPRLDFFNSKAYGLFRACITENLHKALKPQKLK